MIKGIYFWGVFVFVIFWEVFLKGFVPLSSDTLVGANLPWRDYKWGYTTGVRVKNPPLSDSYSQFFIWKKIASGLIGSGKLPLLNRYSFSGTALLATFHTSVLFPTSILTIILPRFWGWSLHIVLSTLFSGLFMWVYLKSKFKSMPAAYIGSIIYAFSGLMTTWVELGTAVWSMAFIPLLFVAVDRYHAKQKYFYLASVSCLMFLVSASGNVQIVTYLIFLLPAYSICNYKLSKATFWIFVGLIIGLCLSSIQILPTVHFYSRSIRNNEQFSSTINFGLTGIGEIVRLWAPDFFGSPVTYNHWGVASYHENSNFLGVVGTLLAFSYVVSRNKTPFGRFFTGVFLISLGMGYSNPVSEWLFSRDVPVLTFSSASRIFFMTTLSGAILSALAVEKSKINGYVLLALLITTCLFLILTPAQFSGISLRNSVIPLTMILVIFTAGLLPSLHRHLPLLLILISAFEMSRYFRKYNPFIPQKLVFPSTPAIEYLQTNTSGYRLINESDDIIPPNTWAYYGLSSPEGYDPLYSLDYSKLFKVAASDHYFSKPHRYLDLTDFRPEYLDVLSVKYAVTRARSDSYLTPLKAKLISAGWKKVFTDKSIEIYQNPGVLPLAFSVTEYKNYITETDLAEALESPDFSPRSVLAFYPPNYDLPKPAVSARVSNIEQVPNGLNVRYSATGSSLLLVSQGYDPAWKAQVGETQIPVYRADGGLLAVAVPPGERIVKMRYFPDTLVWGAAVSALSGILLIAGFKIRP